MRLGLQLRLGLSYLALLGLFALTLAGGAALALQEPLVAHLSLSAWETGDRLVERAEAALAEGGWPGVRRALRDLELPRGAQLALHLPDGRSWPIRGRRPLQDGAALAQAFRGEPVARVLPAGWGRRRLLGLWLPLEGGRAVLSVQLPTRLPRRLQGELAWALVGPALLALGVTLGAGLLMASRISGPVRRLARASEELGSGDLSRRVAEEGVAELGELAARFNRMAENLERQDRQRRELLADVSHALRTPLAAIQGWTEALADGLARGEEPKVLERIQRETRFMARTVARLLELSRWEAGEARIALEPLSLQGPLLEAIEAVAPLAESREVSLTLTGALAGLQVRADRERLRELLQILLENAVEHGGAGVAVNLSVEALGDRVGVTVSDTGPGIPSEARARLFQRFGGRGTGLGLSIGRQIARAHGGDLELLEGPGARFRFTLSAQS